MSLITRIGRIFGEQERKKVSIDDAIKIIEGQRSEKTRHTIDESYSYALQIYSEIQALRGMISAFKNAKIEEKKAKASNDVKDRFCLYSEKQLSATEKPEKDLDKINEFLYRTERTFTSLGGLTQKQMMHIGFFFKGEISAISRKAVLINDLVLRAKKCIDSLGEYESFYRVREEITFLKQKASLMENEKSSAGNVSERMKADIKNIENDIDRIDIKQLNEAEKESAEAESQKGAIEQELISLLAIEKTLKKLRHHKNLSDNLLDAYISSPIAALIVDNEMKIFQFIEQAISLASRLEAGAKSMLKLKRIVEKKDYINKKRKELIESAENVQSKKKKLNDIKASIGENRKRLDVSKASIEAQLNDNLRMFERICRDIDDTRKKTEDRRNALKMMAERLTGAELE